MSDTPNVDDSPQAQDLARRIGDFLLERDQMSRALGMRILDIGPGRAQLAMVVRADMVNGHGSCHGGVLFSFGDTAFAFACNTYNAITVAAGATIDYLMPAMQGDKLTALAHEVWRSHRSGVYDVVVMNQKQDRVALFRGRSRELAGKLISN